MPRTLLLPMLLLLIALCGSLILLRVDAREKELRRRVADVSGGEKPYASDQEGSQGIRVAARPHGMMTPIIRLMRIPVELKEANIVPVWLVCLLGIGVAFGSYMIASLYFSRWISLGEAIVAGLMFVRGIFGWETRRYTTHLTRQLPDVIELIASTVTAGLPAIEGLRNVAREMSSPTREQFERVIQEIDLGVAQDAALLNLHSRTGVTEYAILAVTLGVQARSGGRLVETVQTLAETIRQRLAIVARGNALAAESKLSAYVIALMPVVGGLVLTIIKPGYLYPLFFDPRGNKMLMIAIGTLLAGVLIMRRMIRGALSD